jgi:hypothetical protein
MVPFGGSLRRLPLRTGSRLCPVTVRDGGVRYRAGAEMSTVQ